MTTAQLAEITILLALAGGTATGVLPGAMAPACGLDNGLPLLCVIPAQLAAVVALEHRAASSP